MKEIDWSKAPEDATHWHDEYDCYVACWVKEQEGQRYYSRADGLFGKWIIDSDPLPIEKCIPRHVAQPAWSGEGLPPVGTVCEVAPHNSQWGFDTIEPRRCTILAYHADFVWLDTGVPGTPISTRTDKVDFNVIRTPEQIAEEEREKAIDTILDDLSLCPECRYIAKRVYESGYRKVTP